MKKQTPATETTRTNADKPQPLTKILVGSVKATVWANTGEGGRISYAISVAKLYKGQDEKWHETNSYFPEDLPKLALAATKAYEAIHFRTNEKKTELPETHVEKLSRNGASKKTR